MKMNFQLVKQMHYYLFRYISELLVNESNVLIIASKEMSLPHFLRLVTEMIENIC